MRIQIIAALIVLLALAGCGRAQPDMPAPGTSSERLKLDNLVAGQKVASPLTITGQAKLWYFEASFPVEIRDANGAILAQVPAQAQGEWMTEEFVPFAVTLEFAAPATATGTVVLRKDNPSGLPELDESVEIPVVF